MQKESEIVAQAVLISSSFFIFLIGLWTVRIVFIYKKRKLRHEQELSELKEAFKRTLLQSKLEIQEQTLDHIAKELHANVSHIVSLININLSEILPLGSELMKERIIETKSLAKHLLTEIKALSACLNTDHIMHLGFLKALDNELKRVVKAKKMQLDVVKCGREYRMSPEHEIILFRLCQEVLNNIVRYAKASRINVSINFQPTIFVLGIKDNGVGFDIANALNNEEGNSTGLINIKRRAELINAEVVLESELNKGTFVEIRIPKN